MQINPGQFAGFEFSELLAELAKGKTVTTMFGLTFKPEGGQILLKLNPEMDKTTKIGDMEGDEIERFENNAEGLKQAIIRGMSSLEDIESIDGFQVENEDAENFERESFEVINLDLALQDLVNARKDEPDYDWFINIIGRGDVEDPTLISGVADFDIKDAPLL